MMILTAGVRINYSPHAGGGRSREWPPTTGAAAGPPRSSPAAGSAKLDLRPRAFRRLASLAKAVEPRAWPQRCPNLAPQQHGFDNFQSGRSHLGGKLRPRVFDLMIGVGIIVGPELAPHRQ